MKRNWSFIVFLSLVILLSITPNHRAGECRYGSVQAWFRTANEPWENATVHPVLSRGESFEIKVNLSIKTDLRVVYIKLHEFGTSVYEVITGPSRMEQLFELWKPDPSHQPKMYIWTMQVKTNTSWINGNSPLELYVQFTKNDNDDATITFDILNAFVIDAPPEAHSSELPNETVSSHKNDAYRLPSLSTVASLLVVIVIHRILQKQHALK
jgi:sarcinarray family protein